MSYLMSLPSGSTLNADRSDNIQGGTMQTSVCLSSSGQLTGITRTFTKVKMIGFNGSVQVVLFTDDGRSYVGQQHQYGVDGTWVGRSDRTETWIEQVPVEFASKVTECAIIHSHEPRPIANTFNELKSDLGSIIVSLIPG